MPLPTHEILSDAADTYGSDAFWLVSLGQVKHNIRAFREAFVEAGIPNVRLAWSVKTQWLPAIMRAAMDEGVSPEVVSGHELDLAIKLGADPRSIIYNGVGKSHDELLRAANMGVLIHLDSQEEVSDIVDIAKSATSPIQVALRANVDLGLPGRGRFGIDAVDGQLQAAYRDLQATPKIRICGLHLHISGARQACQFGLRMRKLIELVDSIWEEGEEPDYIDIGGGFCGNIPAELADQMPFTPPKLTEYSGEIAKAYLERWPAGGPTLILEPGVALAADTMMLAARVLAVKRVGGERHAITSASVYTVKPMQHPMNMPFIHVPGDPARPESREPTIVSGYTCMETDILHRSSEANLERGDWILFQNCGAYTNVLTPRFIRGVPPALATTVSGLAPCMPGEQVDDWLKGTALPQ